MNLIDFFNSDELELPKTYGSGDFEGFLDKCFAEYLAALAGLEGTDPVSARLKESVGVAEGFCDAIRQSIARYLDGYPSKAFDTLANGLAAVEHPWLDGLASLPDVSPAIQHVYRVRTGAAILSGRREMFHLPYQLRHLVRTQRYMIEIAEGNILDADADALVNTVNCAGIMGKGLALQFKQAFPENFKAYEAACRAREVVAGTMFIFDNGRLVMPQYIVNFPTKRHWRDKSRIEDIQSGLRALIQDVRRLGIRSIAVPPLGCGLGGLNWRDIRPMIEDSFSELPDVHVLLFPPVGPPDAKIAVV